MKGESYRERCRSDWAVGPTECNQVVRVAADQRTQTVALRRCLDHLFKFIRDAGLGYFFMERSASVWMRAIRNWSLDRERMRSNTSFSSLILDRDFRPAVGLSTRVLIGTSRTSAMRIKVSSEGRA